jgi:hypothetical protein
MTIFYCLRFDTLWTWRARSLYLYHPGTGCPSYTPGTGFLFRRLLRLTGLRRKYSKQSQSRSRIQSYFTTCSLPPISSSWRQAPWDPRPDFFFNWTPASIDFKNILFVEKMGLSLMNIPGLSSRVPFTHIARYWKLFLLHYTQVLCQYRPYRADHAYVKVKVMLRPTISRPVCLGIKPPSGA